MTRLSASLFVIFALLGLTAAQGPSSLPSCASKCAQTASTAAGCNLSDIPCLCSHQSFISATLQCSRSSCGLEDQSSASGVLEEMCATVPTSTPPPSSSTRPPPASSSSAPAPSPTAPSPRPQNPSSPPTPTPTPTPSPAPATTTVHDGTTTVTDSPPGTTLIPATGNATTGSVSTGNTTTVVLSTITGPAPSGAADRLVRGGWWSGAAVVLGLVVL